MDLFILFIIIIVVAYLAIKRPREKKKELTPDERKKQREEMAKAVEELINEVIQESDYGKKTNEEIEQLKSETKRLQKELNELKGVDYEKQIRKE